MDDLILVERDGAVETVTLNRPDKLNAVTPALALALHDYFAGLADRLDVRVVLLRGAGRAFCAGAELGSEAFAAEGPGRNQRQMAMQRLYSGIVRAMRRCPQPIIALLHGPVCGAGFSLALAADIRVGAPDTRMNAAYFRVGLGGCDMGSGYMLPRLVGLSYASELLLTGAFANAERAQTMGLLNRLVPIDELRAAADAIAEDMLRGSPMGLRMTKETLALEVDAPGLEAGLTLEDRQQVILLATRDHVEAVSAFQERRPPSYRDE